jgi:hypothetical protein
MIDRWVEWRVVLDGGVYEEQDATAVFYVRPHDHTIELETFLVEGVIYDHDVIKAQIGEQAMADLIKRADAWWDDDGYRNWRSDNEWNGARFHA